MPLSPNLLTGTQSVAWTSGAPPTGAIPELVFLGRDDAGLGPIQVALATVSTPPSKETMRALHALRKGKSTIQLVVGAILGDRIWIFGPDERTQVIESLPLDQGCRQLQSALDEPNALAAYTRLGQFRRSLDTTSLVGVTNSGLFASYHIRENVPKRADWQEACAKSKPWLSLRTDQLIKALGFNSEKTAGNALLLSSGTPQSKAVAILLDESEQFDSTSARHTGISPVAFGLNVAARQGVPWLFVLRKDQIRIYPAKDGVGVGQKGQVETYLEIDLAAIDSERAGLLALIFSADALESNGTAHELLEGSQRFASQLGLRLRERIYEHVVPQLSKSVAEHLRDQGTALDSEGLSLAYRLTLRILFRLLFQAYAEDRGLLPAGRNEGYDANSLKTIAKRIINTPAEQFGKSKTLWFDLVQVWDAIDEGNETWNVPAYNGGLFGTDPEIHAEGAQIEKLGIQDDILGPVLQHLLIDISEDNVPGPVDFRSLSVREFGTIYEGLLESSLSVATQDLTVDSKGAWVPALKSDSIIAAPGDVYFHSASGERKATGSYFTPSDVVDFLIESSLEPALLKHLERIRGHLLKGDEASAARDFFDFRVADLAMGSGHFLVAAVDRIEARMRAFLSEKDTQVPGINAELNRLKIAAQSALGKDESIFGEIEPASLLRRQIARRCIYGLDLNPLAVELSRLALWIHTFVPGLPMSNLDHGLVCANSLTGIGTVDEALHALSPDLPKQPLSKGRGAPMSFYENSIVENLEKAKTLLIDVANSDEAKKSEVKNSAVLSKNARLAAEPTRDIFNAAIAARVGVFNPANIFDEVELSRLANTNETREIVSRLNPAHMPYLFPEVFMRDHPGFDVLLGNPPWEKLHVNSDSWWSTKYPGFKSLGADKKEVFIEKLMRERPDLRVEFENVVSTTKSVAESIVKGPFPGIGDAHIDLFAAFAWRFWTLLRTEGTLGIVLPRGALSGAATAQWRKEVFVQSEIQAVTLLNNKGWVFPNVHPQTSISVLSITKTSNPPTLKMVGPYSSRQEFSDATKEIDALRDLIDPRDFVDGSDIASIPLLQGLGIEIFTTMNRAPRLSEKTAGWEVRPVQGDINQTTNRDLIRFDASGTPAKNEIEVWTGKTFNIYELEKGPIVGLTNSKDLGTYLSTKLERQLKLQSSSFYGLKLGQPPLETLPLQKFRLAFRDVTNRTNTRTAIFTLIPENVCLVESAPYLFRKGGSASTDAYLLGVFNSIIFDWYARLFVEGHLKFYILNNLPVPRVDLKTGNLLQRIGFSTLEGNYKIIEDRIVQLVATLLNRDIKYKSWLATLSIKIEHKISGSEIEEELAEIDALVAKLYGLNEKHIAYIFKTFHRGADYSERLNKVTKYFQAISK
jgi:hypothetical protein